MCGEDGAVSLKDWKVHSPERIDVNMIIGVESILMI